MRPDFKVHNQEIVRFLELMVIKFEFFGDYLDETEKYAPMSTRVEGAPETYCYYRILGGDDTLLSSEVLVYVPTLGEYRPLTKELVDTRGDIRAYYFSAENRYEQLSSKYPDDWELIKRIFFPVDVAEAIAADNLTILRYQTGILESAEEDDIIEFLQEMLTSTEYRWYINTWESDDLYPLAFWSFIWSILPVMILSRRLGNLHSELAHTFFIWEFLQSRGIPNISHLLTRDQETYLYRNIRYLQQNFGKHFILAELEEAFLKPHNCHFAGKRLVNTVEDREATVDRVPEVLDTRDREPTYTDSRSMTDLYTEIHASGYDTFDVSQQMDTNRAIAMSRRTEYQTKYLEIKSSAINRSTRLLVSVAFDTISNLIGKGRLHHSIGLNNDVYGSAVGIVRASDIFLLISFLLHQQIHDEETDGDIMLLAPPVNLPSSVAIVRTDRDFDPEFSSGGSKFLVDSWVDVDDIYSKLPTIPDAIPTAETLETYINECFVWFDYIQRRLFTIHSLPAYDGLMHVLKHIAPKSVHAVIPAEMSYTTYGDFLASREILGHLAQEASDSPEMREQVIDALIGDLIPIDFTSPNNSAVLMDHVREIFRSLVSYNVAFVSSESGDALTLWSKGTGGIVDEVSTCDIGVVSEATNNGEEIELLTDEEIVFTVPDMWEDTVTSDSEEIGLTIVNQASEVKINETTEAEINIFKMGCEFTLIDELV